MSPGPVDTVPAYNGTSPAGVEASQLRRDFLSHHCELKRSSLNAEYKTEQLMCEVRLKNIPITTDKDFIITLLKTLAWILPK